MQRIAQRETTQIEEKNIVSPPIHAYQLHHTRMHVLHLRAKDRHTHIQPHPPTTCNYALVKFGSKHFIMHYIIMTIIIILLVVRCVFGQRHVFVCHNGAVVLPCVWWCLCVAPAATAMVVNPLEVVTVYHLDIALQQLATHTHTCVRLQYFNK